VSKIKKNWPDGNEEFIYDDSYPQLVYAWEKKNALKWEDDHYVYTSDSIPEGMPGAILWLKAKELVEVRVDEKSQNKTELDTFCKDIVDEFVKGLMKSRETLEIKLAGFFDFSPDQDINSIRWSASEGEVTTDLSIGGDRSAFPGFSDYEERIRESLKTSKLWVEGAEFSRHPGEDYESGAGDFHATDTSQPWHRQPKFLRISNAHHTGIQPIQDVRTNPDEDVLFCRVTGRDKYHLHTMDQFGPLICKEPFEIVPTQLYWDVPGWIWFKEQAGYHRADGYWFPWVRIPIISFIGHITNVITGPVEPYFIAKRVQRADHQNPYVTVYPIGGDISQFSAGDYVVINECPFTPLRGDNFDDNDLDPSIWTVYVTGDGVATEQNQRLELSCPVFTNYVSVSSEAKMELTGDFDVQIDLTSISDPHVGSNYATFLVQSDANWYASAGLRKGGIDAYYGTITVNGVGFSSGFIPSPDTSGKFRITRVGNTLTCYYWSAGTWVELMHRDDYTTTKNHYITVSDYNLDLVDQFAYFDNLVINVGTTAANAYLSLPPSSGGGISTVRYGLDADKGVGAPNQIYFATDTGAIYYGS
jgi:hypothetical protein